MPTTGSSGNPVFQVKTDQPVASLAVNVAWGEEHLPNFLTVLAQEEATATFFVVGRLGGAVSGAYPGHCCWRP